MTMELIFSTYLSRSNFIFLMLHLSVAAGYFVTIIIWLRKVGALRKHEFPRSDVDLRRLLSPLEHFGMYFDFWSSAFIFVGLIGTVGGFVGFIPHLNDREINFSDLQLALSTSAAGILWSLLFNSLTILLDFAILNPLANKMSEHVQGDAVETSIREHLMHIDGTVLRTLEVFNRATGIVIGTINNWAIKIDESQAEYKRMAEASQRTADQFANTYSRLIALPEEVGTKLEGVFNRSNESLQLVLRTFTASLDGVKELPGRLEQSIDESFAKRRLVLDEALTAYRDALAQQARQLEEIFTQTKSVPLQIAEGLRVGGKEAESAVKSAQQSFIEELRYSVKTTVENQIQILGTAAAEMKNEAGALRGKWTDLLDREKTAMQDAMVSALQKSIEIVDRQRENLMRIESALPEGLSKAFTMLIQETQNSSRMLNEATTAHRETATVVSEAVRQLAGEIESSGRRNAYPTPPQIFNQQPPPLPPRPPGFLPPRPPVVPPNTSGTGARMEAPPIISVEDGTATVNANKWWLKRIFKKILRRPDWARNNGK